MRPAAATALLGLFSLAACHPPASGELPRLATREGVDPLVLELLDAALQAAGRSEPGALLELAKTYDANGLPELAARTYALCLERDPEDARIHYHMARSCQENGESERALSGFQRALALDPGYAPVHWRAGEVLFELGRLAEAEAAFSRALELEPACVNATLGLARIELERQRPDHALALLEPLTDTRERFVHALRSRARRALGDEPQAAIELRREQRAARVTVVDPWTAEVRTRAGGVSAGLQRAGDSLAAGDAASALHVLEPLYERRPDDLAVAQMTARALVEAGQLERALELLERARRTHPDQYRLELTTAQALDKKQAHRRALEHLLRARELNPAYGPTLGLLGEVQAKLGQHAEAEASLAAALEAGEDELRTRLVLGQVRLERGAIERALAGLKETCEEFPGSGTAWAHLAEAQARAGDREAARQSLARAEERDPENERLARVRAFLGEDGVPR